MMDFVLLCKREGANICILITRSNKVFNCHSRYLRWGK